MENDIWKALCIVCIVWLAIPILDGVVDAIVKVIRTIRDKDNKLK